MPHHRYLAARRSSGTSLYHVSGGSRACVAVICPMKCPAVWGNCQRFSQIVLGTTNLLRSFLWSTASVARFQFHLQPPSWRYSEEGAWPLLEWRSFDPGHYSEAVAIKKKISSLAQGEPPPYGVQDRCHLLLIDMFGSEPSGLSFRHYLLSGQCVWCLTT